MTLEVVLVRISIAVKRSHDHDNSYKGKHLTEVAACGFRSSVHYHHGGEHGSMQAVMVLGTF